MADRWAVATGSWSNTATWNGGTLPASGDDVYSNTFTVTIDQDITANTLRNAAGSGITAGGSFVHSSGTHSITVTAGIHGATHGNPVNGNIILTVSGGTVTLNANINGGAGTNRQGVAHTGGTLTVNGNLTGGSSTTASHAVRVSVGASALTVNGNVTASAGIALSVGSGVTLVVTGAVKGGNSGAPGISTSSTITVHGSIHGSDVLSGGEGVLLNAGKIRVDADLRWGFCGSPPISGAVTGGSPGVVVFMRGGTDLSATAPSDDNWPLATGADISLVEGGGGGTPGRYLNVGGVATPI